MRIILEVSNELLVFLIKEISSIEMNTIHLKIELSIEVLSLIISNNE